MNKPTPSSRITADQDAIVTEIEIAAPPERIFQALTDPAQLIRWWSDDTCKTSVWEMDARRGGAWRFEASDPSGKIVVNGVSNFIAHGEITEFDPPRVLAYTWFGNWHDHPARPSTARWELSATSTGTRVKITHSGLAGQPVARKDYSGGWPALVELLKEHCE